MNFVWITENYRVNIESIFSMEHRVFNNPRYGEWKNNYEKLLNSYETSMIPLKKEDGTFLEINKFSPPEDIKLYAELITNEIFDKIGPTPDEYTDSYIIILSTGLKIEIVKDKFEAINKMIDKYQEKRED